MNGAWSRGATVSIGGLVRRGGLAAAAAMAALTVAAATPFDLGVDAYRAGDFGRARLLWEQALAAGDWDAARDLGQLYRLGRGVTPDAARAADYYRIAADHGIYAAELNLAELYLSGEGVPHDEAKAEGLLADARDHGVAEAEFRLRQIAAARMAGEPAPPPVDAPPVDAPPVETPPVETPAVTTAPPVATVPPTAVAAATAAPPPPVAWAHLGSYRSAAAALAEWSRFTLPPGLDPYVQDYARADGSHVARLYATGPEPVIAAYCAARPGDRGWCEVADPAREIPPPPPTLAAGP